jgi:hypothetical protein
MSLILPAHGPSQVEKHTKTLVLRGSSEEAAVIEINGRAYVELESLTRLIKGSLSFEENNIVLALPVVSASSPITMSVTSSGPSEFSREFLKAGIEEMAVIREWRSTLMNAVQRGYPVTEDWIENFRAQAQEALLLASLDASTESDRSATPLLANELNNMERLSGKFVEANKSMTYVFPDALQNDPLDQRILKCAHSLAAMAASGELTDDEACR